MKPALLADENIARAVVRGLRALGYEVAYVAEDEAGFEDPAVMERARREQRWLLTHDRDYGTLIFRQGLPAPPSIIYLRQVPLDPDEAVSTIVTVIGSVPDGALFITVNSRGRVRTRPLPQHVGS
jgi:predicted nuclease of predicted toxin-antitoxin system